MRFVHGVSLLAAVATLTAASASSTAGVRSTIVPPQETAARRTYPQWLARWWQVRLQTPPTGSVCQHVAAVELLIGPTKPTETDRCSIRDGDRVYVNGPSGECSTIEPAPSHGDTDAQLKRCARKSFSALSNARVTLDGHAVGHLDRWAVASAVYRFHLPRRNILGATKRTGRSAAYGEGYLLRGLSQGLHVVHETGDEGGGHLDLTYQITVKP